MAEKKETKEEFVPVTLPFVDDPEAKQQLFVSLNFKNYLIRRGETVMVPVGVKKIVDDMERARMEASREAKRLAFKDPMKNN